MIYLYKFDKTQINNMNHFGERIRDIRLSKNIRQRQIAAVLETDTAFVSKLEKGKKQPKREQVIKLANLLQIDQEELLSLWLADKVYEVVKDENMADKALKTVSINIKKSK